MNLLSWVLLLHYCLVWFDYWQFSFNVGILSVFGNLEGNYREQLKENYCIVEKGYNSFPNKIPGTSYSKALLVSFTAVQILVYI